MNLSGVLTAYGRSEFTRLLELAKQHTGQRIQLSEGFNLVSIFDMFDDLEDALELGLGDEVYMVVNPDGSLCIEYLHYVAHITLEGRIFVRG